MTRVDKKKHFYLGYGVHPSHCLLEYRHFDDYDLVIVTDKDGTSVTNAAEDLALEICKAYNINPERLEWVEHYEPSESSLFPGPTWDRVEFDWTLSALDMTPLRATNPTWRRVLEPEVNALRAGDRRRVQ